MRSRTWSPKGRREEIAETALRLIGQRGISNLTMAALAAEIGITAGALFRHFKSRDAILEAAADVGIARLEAAHPDPGLPPLDRLRAFATRRSEAAAADPGVRWLLSAEQAVHALPKDAAWKLDGAARRSVRILLDALAEGAARGEIRDDFAPEVLLVPVAGTIDMLARSAPGTPGAPRNVLPALVAMLAPRGR